MYDYAGKKLAVMQPYFFPYIGYFSLIQYTDRWIVFDTVQHIRRGWVNRNRILAPAKPNGGWQYIALPTEKASRETPIKEIQVKGSDWQQRILRQIEHYRKSAPCYNEVVSFLQRAFSKVSDLNIVRINMSLLEATCEYLSLPFRYEVYSEMCMPEFRIEKPGDWALKISEHLGVSEYCNPPGGIDLFPREEWNNKGVKLTFLESNLPWYSQRREESIMGLSILDVMLFNSPEEASRMIRDYTLYE